MAATSGEEAAIRVKLAELDGDGWLDDDASLTEEQKALIESRIEAHEKSPETLYPGKSLRPG